MRIGAFLCFLIAAALVVLGLVNAIDQPIALYISAGLLAVLGLWLSQQPKRDDRGADEGRPD